MNQRIFSKFKYNVKVDFCIIKKHHIISVKFINSKYSLQTLDTFSCVGNIKDVFERQINYIAVISLQFK